MSGEKSKMWFATVSLELVDAVFVRLSEILPGCVIYPEIRHDDSCPKISPTRGECSCETVEIGFRENEVPERLAPDIGLMRVH